MHDSDRKSTLLTILDQMLDTWQRWSENMDLKFVTRSLEEAIDDCLLLFSEGSLPGDMRLLAGKVVAMKEPWERWKQVAAVDPHRNPIPGNDLWKTLEDLKAMRVALKARPPIKLESIAKLRSLPGMTDGQICRMYGFFDADGRPETWKVDEEADEPGKHSTKIPGWLPPVERRRLATEQAQDQASARAKANREAKIAQLNRPAAKESIQELLREPGMSGKQLCKMKHIEREELESYCLEHHLKVPEWEPRAANALSGDFDKPVPADDNTPAQAIAKQAAEAAANALAEQTFVADPDDEPSDNDAVEIDLEPAGPPEMPAGPLDMEQQIILYHQAGIEPRDIAQVVSADGNRVTQKKVEAVIARWQKNPDSVQIPAGSTI